MGRLRWDTTPVPVSDVAGALGWTVSETLLAADRMIEEVVSKEGLEAARGLSTLRSGSYLTHALAARLRARHGGN